ncbi:SUN domain-containing protein 3 isoform X2 [Lates calcarifer]|uniref:SUN domain-containing protein 3 isoform X2 n=1 Tax=Lates calcarifer TaxID=8187 RepID=A0AAJ8BHI9_LATCA|nr:SUN domain-containing protein 3 isoform X2 [Lates calcarifer]
MLTAMSRRSHRLENSGYYDENMEPIISYKETLHRIFKRRRNRRQPKRREAIINKSDNNRGFTTYNLILSLLYCGLVYMILNHNFVDHGLTESPVSPTITIEDPTAIYTNIEKRLRHLQDEVLRFKEEMNSLLPVADVMPNFALESLGSRVVFSRSSEAYQTQEAHLTFLGIPLRKPPVSPRVVIQGHSPLLPGRCWAFAGGQGHLFITLSDPVTISHVTLGHISKDISPTGAITSAPKEFSVYGMKNVNDEETHLGTFFYDQDGDPVQTFKIPNHKNGFNFVKLQVNNNWGHPDYTCLYNFRVHGKLANRGERSPQGCGEY